LSCSNELVERVEVSQLLGEQEPLMGSELTDQGTLQLGQLGAELASSEIGERGWIDSITEQGGEDLAT
jgi:hypothetical protein